MKRCSALLLIWCWVCGFEAVLVFCTTAAGCKEFAGFRVCE